MKYHIFDGVVEQCKLKGISPTAALVECGIDRAAVTRWGNGGGTTLLVAQKVADYFGCTIDDLVSPKCKKEKPAPETTDNELDRALGNLMPQLTQQELYVLAQLTQQERLQLFAFGQGLIANRKS